MASINDKNLRLLVWIIQWGGIAWLFLDVLLLFILWGLDWEISKDAEVAIKILAFYLAIESMMLICAARKECLEEPINRFFFGETRYEDLFEHPIR